MLHIERADGHGTYCSTETDSTPGEVCVVCTDIHTKVEAVTRPKIEKIIKQYQRGLIGGLTLGVEAYTLAVEAEAVLLGVRS